MPDPAPPAPPPRKRCSVYIDGFNWYFGIFQQRPAWKWLNVPMVIVSGDSDIEPAVHWVRLNYPHIRFTVYVPALEAQARQRRNDFYLSIGITCRYLPLAEVERHQLPPKVTLANGNVVERPAEWA